MKPKFVRKANMWTVTEFIQPKTNAGKVTQNQDWFRTEAEALKFIEEKTK